MFLRRFAKLLKFGKRGYTLLEVAAVIGVTATLAAVAMPVVSDKIAASKLVAAQQEVQSIRDAIVLFMKDTGVPPFYLDAILGLTLPKEDFSGSPPFNPMLATADGEYSKVGSSDWPIWWGGNPNPTGVPDPLTLDGQLINNVPRYPTMGTSAWKGPYIPSLKKDPWGNKYLVNIRWLAEPTGFPKYQRAVYVISAGPNGIIETNFDQKIRVIEATADQQMRTQFVVVGDDIVSRIQ